MKIKIQEATNNIIKLRIVIENNNYVLDLFIIFLLMLSIIFSDLISLHACVFVFRLVTALSLFEYANFVFVLLSY